jgi:hypothetical protein
VTTPKAYTLRFANRHPISRAKAERKGRTEADVDELIRWLSGYEKSTLEPQLEEKTGFESLISQSSRSNSQREEVAGVVRGLRVGEIEDETMR